MLLTEEELHDIIDTFEEDIKPKGNLKYLYLCHLEGLKLKLYIILGQKWSMELFFVSKSILYIANK